MEQFIVEGHHAVRHNDGHLMLVNERTVITPDGVQVEISGMDPDVDPRPVSTSDPAVVQYERERAEARQHAARLNRPITPLFKTERDRKASKRQQVNWDQEDGAGT